jgi:5-methylcytosine-specific restriction endonuclease McrA
MDNTTIDKSLLQLKQGTSSDTSIKTLLRYYLDDNINLRPNYQRNEVINRQKASGIIESAVLGIPLPPIYLFKDKEGKLEVIDGQQRLISFFGFLGQLRGVKTKLNGFKLIGLDILTNLNGLDHNHEYFKVVLNDKLLDFTLKTFTFDEEKGFEQSLKYEIFERLNKNPFPIKANSFELWNCIYLSDFTRLIKKIVKTDLFHTSISRKSANTDDLRMDNENDLLRFITLTNNYEELKDKTHLPKTLMLQSVKTHFENKTTNLELNSLEKNFTNTLKRIKLIFGSNIILGQLVNDNPSRKKVYPNLTLLDVITVLFSEEDEKFLQKYRDEIYDGFENFFSDETNRAFIQNSKRGKLRINNTFADRVDFLKSATLDSVRKKYKIEKSKRISIRDKTLEDKLLEKQNGLCPYCKNQIRTTDDYEIDHLQSLDDFGNNDEINLAILHQSCNREKSNGKILI